MPSEDLQVLVGEMQNITMENFKLNENFGQKETELISMENQLRQLAKSDTGLSKKVIQLRKDIQKSREALKEMQVKRIQLNDKKEDVVTQLKSCEVMERRRNDVALETEKTLIEAKEKIKEMEKELIFVNNNRKDL